MPASTATPFRPGPPPAKKQRMSISETYYLAHTARGKLSREAAKGEHNLRRLVGHANLLDSLMIDLADAEREQEAWLDATVSSSSAASSKPAVRWVDSVLDDIPDASDSDEDDEDDASDGDDDEEEEIAAQIAQMPAIRRARSPPPAPAPHYDDDSDSSEEEYDDEYYDDEYDEPELALTRTASHRISQPPELVNDSDGDSDDEPTSPPPTVDTHPLVKHFAATAAPHQHRKPADFPSPVISDERHTPLVAAY